MKIEINYDLQDEVDKYDFEKFKMVDGLAEVVQSMSDILRGADKYGTVRSKAVGNMDSEEVVEELREIFHELLVENNINEDYL